MGVVVGVVLALEPPPPAIHNCWMRLGKRPKLLLTVRIYQNSVEELSEVTENIMFTKEVALIESVSKHYTLELASQTSIAELISQWLIQPLLYLLSLINQIIEEKFHSRCLLRLKKCTSLSSNYHI
jgi:hypothetical protein